MEGGFDTDTDDEELFMEDPEFDNQMVQAWAAVKNRSAGVQSDCWRLVRLLRAVAITMEEIHGKTATQKED